MMLATFGMSTLFATQDIHCKSLGYQMNFTTFLASYPGHVGGEMQPGIHCMRMRVITQNLGDFAYSRKLS